jgi:hypothetical protein
MRTRFLTLSSVCSTTRAALLALPPKRTSLVMVTAPTPHAGESTARVGRWMVLISQISPAARAMCAAAVRLGAFNLRMALCR